jgi:uncharacterized protein YlxW (UPF0749 family)
MPESHPESNAEREPDVDETPASDETPTDPPRGRQRFADALRRPGRAQVVVAVLLGVVGFAAVTQIRANEVDDTYAGYREQALIDVLNGLAGTSQRAQAEITRLERTRDELQSSTSAREAAVEQARKEADTLDIMAGTVPVTGPGVRITIEEEEGPVDIDSLLDTVQELRNAGAEAMQINGQVRVVAQTAFEDDTGGISADGQELEPPYVIDVIGEPSTLVGGLNFAAGPVEQLEGDGATVEVDELQSLDIETVVQPPRSGFAQPGSSQ